MDDYGNKNHFLLLLAPIFAIVMILVIAGLTRNIVNPASASSAAEKISKGTATEEKLSTEVNDEEAKKVFITFSHAGETPEGEYISEMVTIEDAVKQGDIPKYDDKEQEITVSGTDKALAANAVTALKSMGYKKVSLV